MRSTKMACADPLPIPPPFRAGLLHMSLAAVPEAAQRLSGTQVNPAFRSVTGPGLMGPGSRCARPGRQGPNAIPLPFRERGPEARLPAPNVQSVGQDGTAGARLLPPPERAGLSHMGLAAVPEAAQRLSGTQVNPAFRSVTGPGLMGPGSRCARPGRQGPYAIALPFRGGDRRRDCPYRTSRAWDKTGRLAQVCSLPLKGGGVGRGSLIHPILRLDTVRPSVPI
jgi:hypothetical protein